MKSPVEDLKSGTDRWLAMTWLEGKGHCLLPAETEIPAPAITTIFRFLRKTLRRRCNWISSLPFGFSSNKRRSRYSVVRSLGILNFRFFAGGGPSSSPPAISRDFDDDLLPDGWDQEGDGYWHGGVGDLDRMERGDEAGESSGEGGGEMAEMPTMSSMVGPVR